MKAALAIGSYKMATSPCTHPLAGPKAQCGSYHQLRGAKASPADALRPWLGTPEGDAVLAKVLDPNDPLGKPVAPSSPARRVDARGIFRRQANRL